MASAKLSDRELKSRLTPEQYSVLRQQSTEPPFSGEYLDNTAPGVYKCAACGTELFASSDKYESDIKSLAGWPSFADVVRKGAVELRSDNSHGMKRVEVVCTNCGSRLGHLFDDPSSPTNQHYCINSVALNFKKELA